MLRLLLTPHPFLTPLLCGLLLGFPAYAADRVVTLSPHLAELVCAAGGCDRLVGVVAHTDYPPQAAAVQQVGDAFSVNPEVLLPLNPDLILAWRGGTAEPMVERLAALSVPAKWIRVRELVDIGSAIEEVGALIGTRRAARAAADDFRKRLAVLAARYGTRPRLRVLYQIEANPIYSINRESPISQAVALCGGQNVFADLPQIAAPVSKEAAVAANPDVIVFAKQDDTARIREFWQGFPDVRAVKSGDLYAVDANLLARATPRMLQGIEQLCVSLEQARRS